VAAEAPVKADLLEQDLVDLLEPHLADLLEPDLAVRQLQAADLPAVAEVPADRAAAVAARIPSSIRPMARFPIRLRRARSPTT
jgi:hypothetical protein